MASIRATATNVTVSFGLVSFPVDLVSAIETKRTKARTASRTMICPTCEAAGTLQPLRQVFQCSHDDQHGPISKNDAGTAIEVEGELRKADPTAVAEAAQVEGIRDVIALTVHPAEQVEGCTFPSGNIYRLRPRGNEAHYGLVLNLVHDRTKAFVCEVTNKGATLLYRLVERDGMLLLTELVRPERITDPFPLPDVSFDWRLLATGESLVESMCEPFFPDDWADRRKAKLVALAAKLEEQEAPTSTADRSVEGTADEILELMRRSLDAA
jgi:hypothetical protein